MASVTVYSVAHIDSMLDDTVVNAAITGGHLILTLGDGSTVDVGAVVTGIADASDTAKGVVELATDAESLTGTDATRAVTPFGLKAVANTKQPLDADLTAIAALTPTTNNFIQSSGSAWSSRTPTQAVATLAAVGMPVVNYSTGSGYSLVNVPAVYVGPTDPGAVVNGSIWYDTTGA